MRHRKRASKLFAQAFEIMDGPNPVSWGEGADVRLGPSRSRKDREPNRELLYFNSFNPLKFGYVDIYIFSYARSAGTSNFAAVRSDVTCAPPSTPTSDTTSPDAPVALSYQPPSLLP